MHFTLLKKNRMADPSPLKFSTSLEITDSLFTVPSRGELSELLRTLPSLTTDEVHASHSSKEERDVTCCFSFLEVGVLTPRYFFEDPGLHRRYHHFDPDEKTTPLGTDPMNQQPCSLEVTSKSSKFKTCTPKLLTRVSSFAA
jgi:hypothetical protein